MQQTNKHVEEEEMVETSRKNLSIPSIVGIMAAILLVVYFNQIREMENSISSLRKTVEATAMIRDREIDKHTSIISNLMEKVADIERISKSYETKIEDLNKVIMSLQEQPFSIIPDESIGRIIDPTHIILEPEGKLLGDISKSKTRKLEMFESNTPRNYICDQKPILSPINSVNKFVYDETVDRILDVIHTLSSIDSLNDKDSPQYKAACWIIFDDELEISTIDELLFQRYVLAVFLCATNRSEQALQIIETCDHQFVRCDEEGRITSIHSTEIIVTDSFQRIIPSELSHLRSLETLILDQNQLVGTIPPELGRLNNLEILSLNGNNLTGTVPSDIGRLSNLKELRLRKNKINGFLPSDIGNCVQLEHLDITDNAFTGSIPVELYNCKLLVILDLFKNHFSGTISEEIHNLKNLQFLFLAENDFSGSIPSEIGHLSSLQNLSLGMNKFSGPIPEEIRNVHSLKKFILHDNQFTGTLPDFFGSFQDLELLHLSKNQLTGTIPNSIWDHGSYKALLLHDNDLRGTVPDDFCAKVSHNLHLDSSLWFLDEPKIKCNCCTSANCYVWDSTAVSVEGTERPTCPIRNRFNISFFEEYWIQDDVTKTITQETHGRGKTFHTELCLSPFGCYTMWDDGKLVLDRNEKYSMLSKSLSNQKICGAVDICGTTFDATNPRRIGLNHLTQSAISDMSKLSDISSNEYKALCWIMTQDERFDEFNICDGTLLQRYVLALFYQSQQQSISFFDFSSNHTCDWPGIMCDLENRFAIELSLPKQQLTGTLISEFGLLRRLQIIDLSENKLSGTIDPLTLRQMPHLEEFDIGGNKIGGELPNELLLLPQLKILNISHNLLIGTLPNNIIYSQSLESIDLQENLLRGPIPTELIACHNLEVIDLSRNMLGDILPSELGFLKKLRILKLNENRFTGSIPKEMFQALHTEVLMLQSNMLTGSIPSQIGTLENITFMSLSYNSLRGKIPTEIEILSKIEYLHLHQNVLTGFAPVLNIKDKKENNVYITDCGEPSFLLSAPLKCKSCTMCCNSLDQCQVNREWKIPAEYIGYLILSLVPVAIVILAWLVFRAKKRGFFLFFNDDRNPLSIYNEDSVYCLVFSNSRLAWIIYSATAIIQALAFYSFLKRSNFNDEETAWQFTYRCPDNNMECDDESNKTLFGWFMLIMVLTFFLGADYVDSMLQLRKAAALVDFRLFISGFVLFFLTALATFTSFIYNMAVAESDRELIMNAVFLLFINELDEQFLNLLDSIVPGWISKRYLEIQQVMLKKEGLEPEKSPERRGSDTSEISERPIHFLQSSSARSGGSSTRLVGSSTRLGGSSTRLGKGRFTGLIEQQQPKPRLESGLRMMGFMGSTTDIKV